MPSAIWGLDIGHSAIKAVRLERAGGVPVLTTFDVVEIEHGEEESTRPVRVRSALAELLSRRRIGQERVVVSVPGNQTFFRPFGLPAAASSNLAKIVSFEARNQIPFPVNEVLWDFKRIAPGEGGETRVGLVAVRRELIDQMIGLLRQSGFKLEAIQVAPLALYNLVRYELGGGGPYLVLDGGARVTDFVIVDGEEFWFRPLPQSGNDLTRTLEQKFRMSYDEAESLKLKMGDSKQAKKIFQVIEPMLRGFVGDIQRTIGYYKGIRKDVDISEIVVVGNAFRLPGMAKFIEQALAIKIRTLDHISRMRLGLGVDAGWWQEELPGMAVALGLGLQGLGLVPASLDLLPESIRHERMMRRKRPVVAASVGLAVLASGAAFMAAGREQSALTTNKRQIQEGLTDTERYAKLERKAARNRPVIEKNLTQLATGTARERGWALEALDMLARIRGGRGEPVLGESAAGGNGVYISSIHVSRGDPQAGAERDLDGTIVNWWRSITSARDSKGKTSGAVNPMVVVISAEVASAKFTDDNLKEADVAHAQKLRRAIDLSSQVHLTDAALAARRKTDPAAANPLVGSLRESAEDRKKKQLTFRSRSGGGESKIRRSDIERLAWFREAFLGAGWKPEVRPVDSPDVVATKNAEARPGQPKGINRREFLLVTLAWVYDDGSTELVVSDKAP